MYNIIRGNYVKSKPTDSVEFLSLQNLDKGWFQGNQPKKGFRVSIFEKYFKV